MNRLSIQTTSVFLLFLVVLMPVLAALAVDFMLEGIIRVNRFFIDLTIAILMILILSFPLYRLMLRISRQELRTSETKRNVAELIDHAADMILITRPDGVIVHANRKASELLGYSSEEILQMHNVDLDVDCVLHRNPSLHKLLNMGKSVTFETFYRTKSGRKIPIENHVTIAGWIDDVHYLEIARDITRRRQVEEELHASKEALERVRNRLETRMQERTEELVEEVRMRELTEKHIHEIRSLLENLVDSMPSAIIALDNTLKVTQWNPEAERVFDIASINALQKNIIQLLPQFRSSIIRLIRRSHYGKKSLTQRISVDFNLKPRQFDIMIYPLTHTDEDVSGVVIRLDDITEKVRFDEILVQTEKMFSLGGLAAGMAHEINNPLGAILQSAQNISRRCEADFPRNLKVADSIGLDMDKLQTYLTQQKIDQSLEVIKEAGERAATIVGDMLSFARPSHRDAEIVDLEDVLKSSIRLAEKDYNHKRKFDFRSIQIIENYSRDLPKVNAQPNQLRQVFLNLLINAAQALSHHREGEKPTIWVSARQQNNQVRIDIKDNGPGMEERVRRRVFEPFFTTKEEGTGTGLGLSVSYFIVTEQLHGQMFVDSIVGRETTFSVFFPAILLDDQLDLDEHDPIQLNLEDM